MGQHSPPYLGPHPIVILSPAEPSRADFCFSYFILHCIPQSSREYKPIEYWKLECTEVVLVEERKNQPWSWPAPSLKRFYFDPHMNRPQKKKKKEDDEG